MTITKFANMTESEKIEIVKGLITRYGKSIEREPGVKRELADDQITLSKIVELDSAGEDLPANCPYLSYMQWQESMEKEVLTSQKSLWKIEELKVQIEGLQFYVDNISLPPRG